MVGSRDGFYIRGRKVIQEVNLECETHILEI